MSQANMGTACSGLLRTPRMMPMIMKIRYGSAHGNELRRSRSELEAAGECHSQLQLIGVSSFQYGSSE